MQHTINHTWRRLIFKTKESHYHALSYDNGKLQPVRGIRAMRYEAKHPFFKDLILKFKKKTVIEHMCWITTSDRVLEFRWCVLLALFDHNLHGRIGSWVQPIYHKPYLWVIPILDVPWHYNSYTTEQLYTYTCCALYQNKALHRILAASYVTQRILSL